LSWKLITENQIPNNAIIGGFDVDKTPLYICRHKHDGHIIPCKANQKFGCYVTKVGKAVEFKTDYEILMGEHYDWVNHFGGDAVPKQAFVAGSDSENGPIYVGRCDLHLNSTETQVVGKVHHKFYYAFGSTEYSDCKNHQIMIC